MSGTYRPLHRLRKEIQASFSFCFKIYLKYIYISKFHLLSIVSSYQFRDAINLSFRDKKHKNFVNLFLEIYLIEKVAQQYYFYSAAR